MVKRKSLYGAIRKSGRERGDAAVAEDAEAEAGAVAEVQAEVQPENPALVDLTGPEPRGERCTVLPLHLSVLTHLPFPKNIDTFHVFQVSINLASQRSLS